MGTLPSLLITTLLLVSCLYSLFSLYAAWKFFRAGSAAFSPSAHPLPPVSILKPVKGAVPDLYANLASFCRLDYPVFQLLCGVRDPHDPAIAVVHRLQRDFPECDIGLVINKEIIGSNYKVSMLHHLAREAKYDIFVISDSDVHVEPCYLRTIVPPLTDPAVGLVTCPYRSGAIHALPAQLESLIVTTSFTPSVLVASQVEKTTYAFGATMAIKRHCVDQTGGFVVLADYLADDYYLGYLVAQAGYRVQIVPHIVETRSDVDTFSELFHHQLRWARTQRISRPGGHCGTGITYGTVWAVVGLAAFWSSPLLRTLSLITLGLRLFSAVVISGIFLKARCTLRLMWLVPLTDLLSFLVWCISLGGNTVRWHEYTFRVRGDGKMTQVTHPRTGVPP